jgi:hypothetical protein
MQKYIIERDIPGVGSLDAAQLKGAAATSNAALDQLQGVRWVESFVTPEKTFCVYEAENEDVIREHARISGFPATKITPVSGMIDPSTANG